MAGVWTNKHSQETVQQKKQFSIYLEHMHKI